MEDYNALYLIHQCVDVYNFEKVGDYEYSKQARKILEKSYTGAEKEKVVRLQTHKRHMELIRVDEKESISDYVTIITILVNQNKTCG